MRKQKKYLPMAVLFNPLFLLLIWYGLRGTLLLCQYGGIRKRIPALLLTGGVALVWFIIWSVWGIKKKRRSDDMEQVTAVKYSGLLLAVELLVLVGMMVFYGFQVYKSANELNDKLGWYLQGRPYALSVDLSDINFYEDGVLGILAEVEKQIDLPEELYVESNFEIGIQADGTITDVYAFLYGKDKKGATKDYALSYNNRIEDTMSVYLGYFGSTHYEEQQKLQPMIELTEALRADSSLVDIIKQQGDEKRHLLSYYGYRETEVSSSIYQFDSKSGMLKVMEPQGEGATVEGYLINFNLDKDQIVLLKKDKNLEEAGKIDVQEPIDDYPYSQEEINTEKHELGEFFTDENGDMHYYLSDTKEMILHVTDAALGSRAYAFKCDSIVNEIPFGENIGVAEGMYFKDETIGFAALGNASMDYSELYGTMDGGENFTLITLPVEMGEADLEGNTYGLTIQDYDFYGVPYEKNGAIYVKVGTDSVEVDMDYMLFKSNDLGATWSYVKYENQFLQE